MNQGMQETLFDCGSPPRPRYDCVEVIEKMLDTLVPDVLQWMRSGEEHDVTYGEDYINDIRNDLREVINDHYHDGYEIVDQLRHTYDWVVDSDLIDIMDNVSSMMFDIHDDVVSLWVLNNGIKPKLQVGQSVTFHRHEMVDSQDLTHGKIVKIDVKHAVYEVSSEIGRVRLPYEDVKSA